MTDKYLFSLTATLLTFIGFYPYLRGIFLGLIKPHVFSWVIWGISTLIIFFAQLHDNAGAGAWPIGVSACITLFIAALAYLKRADITITQTDWIFFISAMASIPFWFFTDSPLVTVIILTTIDVLGFGPTIRKAWQDPYSEPLLFFGIFSLRNLMVLMAIEHYSATTVLFPTATGIACLLLVFLIIYRRSNRSKDHA